MGPGQQLGSQALPSMEKADLTDVAFRLNTGVSAPPIRMHDTADLDSGQQKRLQVPRRRIGNSGHAYPPDSFTVFLGCDDHHRLGTPMSAPDPFLRGTPIAIVHLHAPAQSVTFWSNHRPTKFVQCCLVAAQSRNPLDSQGTGPCLLAGHQPDPPKPQRERLMRVLEEGPGRHRRLMPALGAMQQVSTRPPRLPMPARRAREPLRLARPYQVLAARLLRSEPRLELQDRPRVLRHAPSLPNQNA